VMIGVVRSWTRSNSGASLGTVVELPCVADGWEAEDEDEAVWVGRRCAEEEEEVTESKGRSSSSGC
jgi:hypothetical protein